MQIEQPGLAGIPITYLPSWGQNPILVPHNGKWLKSDCINLTVSYILGAGIDSSWMAAAGLSYPFQSQLQQQPTAGMDESLLSEIVK